MKNVLRLFLVPLVTLTFAGVSFAQATPAKPATPEKKMEVKAEKPKAEKPKVTRITGQLASVDAKAGTLTVKAKDKDLNLIAESKSAKSALAKVKAGDTVKVSYTEKDGKMIASSIAGVKAAPKAKETAKTAAKKVETKATEKKDEPKAKTK